MSSKSLGASQSGGGGGGGGSGSSGSGLTKEIIQGYDVGIPGLPRRRRPMTMLPYKSKFAQMVNKLKKRSTFEFTKLVEQLKIIEEMVRVDTFIYANQHDALEGKQALLTLWQQLMELADVVPAYRQNLFYTLIFFIVTRYEFDLIHITTSKPSKKNKTKKGKAFEETLIMTGDVSLKPSSDEVAIFREYRRLLAVQTLKVLEQFQSKSLTKVLRKFCSQMLSVAYFRIPILSGPLMDTCTQEMEPSYPEDGAVDDGKDTNGWAARNRGDEWIRNFEKSMFDAAEDVIKNSSQLEVSDKEGTSEFFYCNPSLFQWTLFMENDDREMLLKAKSITKLSQDKYFFKFVSRLVAHISDVLHCTSSSPPPMEIQLVSESNEDGEEGAEEVFFQFQADRSIRWGLIPGYWPMVKAVLKRSLIPLDCYRADLKRCVLRLLANPDLLGLFTKLYLCSTSVLRKNEVNACVDLIDAAFDASCGPNLDAPIPDTFCFEEFFRAVEILLASEQFEVLLKTLCFLYTHCGRFYGAHRIKLLQEILLHKYFFKFFVHWYPAVRRQYHHLLVYKFNRVGMETDEPAQQVRLDIAETHRDNYEDKPIQEDEIKTPQDRSWMKRISSRLGQMFSDSNPSLQRRYSPSFSEDQSDMKQVADSKEILKRQEAAKFELIKEPPVESCEIIHSKLTKDDILEDEVLENNLQVYLLMCEEQLKDPSKRHFDPSLTVYVKDSLEQYKQLRISMQKLQKQKKLRRFDVLTPSMYYDIPKEGSKDSID